MIENVLNSVKESEKQAENMKNESNQKANIIIENARIKALEIKNNSREIAKQERNIMINEAKNNAEINYKKTMEENDKNSLVLIDEKSKEIDFLSEEIVRRIINGSC